MAKPLLLLIPLALFALEACRLSSNETVRLRQTWEFATKDGPFKVSDVLELQQGPAIPYLPGGETGKNNTIGRLPVSIMLSGTKYHFSSDPMWLIGNAVREGRAQPPVSLDGLRNQYTTGFIRRLRRANAKIVIPVEDMPDKERQLIWVATKINQWGNLDGPRTDLPAFEAEHPGFKLRKVTYSVTDEPVDL